MKFVSTHVFFLFYLRDVGNKFTVIAIMRFAVVAINATNRQININVIIVLVDQFIANKKQKGMAMVNTEKKKNYNQLLFYIPNLRLQMVH